MNFKVEDLPKALSRRGAAIIGMRARPESAQRIYFRYLAGYDGSDSAVWSFCQRMAMNLLRNDPDNWRTYLKTLERGYSEDHVPEVHVLYEPGRKADALPLEAAKLITKRPDKYPGVLVSLAESTCRSEVAKLVVPVGLIAKRDGWFSEPD